MSKRLIHIFFATACLAQSIAAQDSTLRKISLSGYVSFMESAMDLNVPGNKVIWESLLHNRLNLNYYPSDQWVFSIQARNRLIVGEQLKLDETGIYKDQLARDMGLADLSWNLFDGKSFVFNTSIDRLYLKYTLNRFEITLGRQRINWGQTYVWNPNDWFNNYSFFDVDYEEKPGSDALRLQYFTGELSGLEGVVRIDSTHRLTYAGLFKTNAKGFDLQFLGGVLSEEDLALGMGWAGGIGQIGFRGEMSYLHPLHGMRDTTGLFFLSLALDYTLSNSLMIQTEAFYNQLPGGSSGKNFTEFYSRPLSVKDLSFTEFNFFAQASYPFTPIFSGSMAVLYYPQVKGYFLGPAITFSPGNNFDISLFLQYFSGQFLKQAGTADRQHYTLGFLRARYSF